MDSSPPYLLQTIINVQTIINGVLGKEHLPALARELRTNKHNILLRNIFNNLLNRFNGILGLFDRATDN